MSDTDDTVGTVDPDTDPDTDLYGVDAVTSKLPDSAIGKTWHSLLEKKLREELNSQITGNKVEAEKARALRVRLSAFLALLNYTNLKV